MNGREACCPHEAGQLPPWSTAFFVAEGALCTSKCRTTGRIYRNAARRRPTTTPGRARMNGERSLLGSTATGRWSPPRLSGPRERQRRGIRGNLDFDPRWRNELILSSKACAQRLLLLGHDNSNNDM